MHVAWSGFDIFEIWLAQSIDEKTVEEKSADDLVIWKLSLFGLLSSSLSTERGIIVICGWMNRTKNVQYSTLLLC